MWISKEDIGMNFTEQDFTLDRIDRSDGHEDYWFKVNETANIKLSNIYNEMCMVGVTEVVYSKDEDIVGIKRQFPFNYDVVISHDEKLKSILRAITK